MSAVVAQARAWIGTPFVHQASVLGAGCDCLGLIRGVWRTLYGAEPELVPAYTPDWSEPQGAEILFAAACRHMRPVQGEWLAGQVLLFRMRDGGVAKHLGILAGNMPSHTFIHAYTGHGVLESPLSDPWRRRVAARFSMTKE